MGDKIRPYVQTEASTAYGVGIKAGAKAVMDKFSIDGSFGAYTNEMLFGVKTDFTQPISPKIAFKAEAYGELGLNKNRALFDASIKNGAYCTENQAEGAHKNYVAYGTDIHAEAFHRNYVAGASAGLEFTPVAKKDLKINAGVSYAHYNNHEYNLHIKSDSQNTRAFLENKAIPQNKIGVAGGVEYTHKHWNFGVNGDTAKGEAAAAIRYTF